MSIEGADIYILGGGGVQKNSSDQKSAVCVNFHIFKINLYSNIVSIVLGTATLYFHKTLQLNYFQNAVDYLTNLEKFKTAVLFVLCCSYTIAFARYKFIIYWHYEISKIFENDKKLPN